MAHVYAGILGPLGLVTSLAHGVLHAQSVDVVLRNAWCSLWAFALAGAVVGWIAERAVNESVEATIENELAAQAAAEAVRTAAVKTKQP